MIHRAIVTVAGSVAASLLAGTALLAPAAAQSASQLTPPSVAPSSGPGVGGTLVFSGEPGLGTPPGAELLDVTLAGVSIEGGLPALAPAHEALVTALAGRRVTVAEIFEAARALESAYARAGFVLMRVVVPAQRLDDGGTLQLVIVDGFIERIETRNVPAAVAARIEAVIRPLVGRSGVSLAEIERRLLIAGDAPGVGLATALATGAEPGGAVLIVEAEQQRVVGFLGIDNTLPALLGTVVATAGVDINSALTGGDLLYARITANPSLNDASGLGSLFGPDPRYRSLSAGYVFPIGIDGLTANIEGVTTTTTPFPSGGLQPQSTFSRLSLRLQYPVLRSRVFNVEAGIAFDLAREGQHLITGIGDLPLSLDITRVLRFTGEAAFSAPWGGVASASVQLSVGIDGLGARSADDATPLLPLSRPGADAAFAKIEAAVNYTQSLAPHLNLGLHVRGQTSFGQPLLRSEQFGIANLTELSTFDAGSVSGDSGIVARAELSSPWDFDAGAWRVAASPYVFGAWGLVHLENPTALEFETVTATEIGLGVRLGAAPRDGTVAASLTLEYGRHFSAELGDASRFTMVGSLRF